jgi:hypothetical protein
MFHSRGIDIRREHSLGETCPAHRAMFERVIKAFTNMPRKSGIGFRLERARMRGKDQVRFKAVELWEAQLIGAWKHTSTQG